MPDLDRQEREAPETMADVAWQRLDGVENSDSPVFYEGFGTGYRAALAAREEPLLSEQDVIAHSPYRDTAEWKKVGDEEKAHWRMMAEAAREDLPIVGRARARYGEALLKDSAAVREEPRRDVTELMERVLPFLMDYKEPAGDEPPFECDEAEEMAVKRDIEAFLQGTHREDTCECDSCNRVFPLGAIEFGRGGKAVCPECREDTERPDGVDWDRVRRIFDEAVAAVAPPDAKEIRVIAGSLCGWAESSEHRPGELTIEQANFALRMAADLHAVLVQDTERSDEG